ncbi:MAG: stage II sporulation protein M, partial [Myxococcales bacterium]|nr:stage II sporulation protein M [Myxococcales bacterium]
MSAPAPQPAPLRSVQFRREREAAWIELDDLVTRVEQGGLKALGAHELRSLATLYRAALSGLSVARAISLDQNLVAWLEGLCARAYVVVYGSKQPVAAALWAYASQWLPRTIRRFAWPVLLSAAFMVGGGLLAFFLTLSDMGLYDAFVAPGMAQGRTPAATTEFLRQGLFDDGGGLVDRLVAFASFLFTHNARIGLLATALGFGLGLPTAWLMFANGLTLGGFAALYHSRGLSVELWSWLLPHGITELGAVILCGGAGFAVGSAVLFPGARRRLDALAEVGRDAAGLALGAVGMLALAALLEGIFRQT